LSIPAQGIDLLSVLLIIFLGRTLGYIFSRFGFQSLVGEVLGGIILSPLVLSLITPNATLEVFSFFGIIMLMVLSGLLTNFTLFSKQKFQSFTIAFFGVVVSMVLVICVLLPFNVPLIAIIFTAILLSNSAIEVCTKIMMERMPDGKTYATIVGASFFDDILAVFLIGIITSAAFHTFSPMDLGINVVIVGLFLLISLYIIPIIFEKIKILDRALLKRGKEEKILLTFTILFSLGMALAAKLAGLSEVIGAYVGGLVIGKWASKVGPMLKRRIAYEHLLRDIQPVVIAIFSPLFFGYIGVILGGIIASEGISLTTIVIASLLSVAAIAGKILGCGLGAKLSSYPKEDSLLIGTAMIGRGALEMVLVNLAYLAGIISAELFVAIVIATLVTVISAPILYAKVHEKYF